MNFGVVRFLSPSRPGRAGVGVYLVVSFLRPGHSLVPLHTARVRPTFPVRPGDNTGFCSAVDC